MSYAVTLSFAQALQMVAIAPCLVMILYLCAMSRHKQLSAIPVLYFLSVACSLLVYLLPAFIPLEGNELPYFLIRIGEALIPALSFLLIFQFLLNRIPPWVYWSILTVPLIASSGFIYQMTFFDQLCLTPDIDVCFSATKAYYLNDVLVSSLIFFLLVLIVARKSVEIVGDPALRTYKYWLVISLIFYNIILLVAELGYVAESFNKSELEFAVTMVSLAFIYMVFTSIFRVFTDLFDIRTVRISLKKNSLTAYEQELVRKVERMLEQDKIYRETGFSRATLADQLGIGEHILSRIINLEFKKSFSDLANDYRIREAKERLAKEAGAITTIAFDVGFNSIASFNRVFKANTGMSPSEYRETMLKDIV